MSFEVLSRIIAEVPESTKIWFADYCRRNRTTMSRMVRDMIQSLKQTTAEAEQAQEK